MANEHTSENASTGAAVEPATTAKLELTPATNKVTDSPDKFGVLAEAFTFLEERRIYDIIANIRGKLIVLVTFLSLPILAYAGYYVSPLGPGILSGGLLMGVLKILTFYTLVALILVLAAIGVYGKSIIHYLELAEEYAQLGRDMTALYMPVYREQLKELNEKLLKQKYQADIPTAADLAKDLMPFVSLFLKKEKNIIKWGLTGLRVYKTVSKFFKGEKSSGERESST